MAFADKVKEAMIQNADPALTGGFWHKKSYPHIYKRVEDNFIDGTYPEVCDVKGKMYGKSLHLHPGVASMNSSQALCINYFKSFFESDSNEKYLLDMLKEYGVIIKNSCIKNAVFEYVPYKEENTNFDFYIVMDNDVHISFEAKYAESEFGKPRSGQKDKYHDKWLKTYADRVCKCKYLKNDEKDFYNNYQINRNISYAGGEDYVLFITPKANKSKGIREGRTYIDSLNEKYPTIMNLYWEDLVMTILNLTKDNVKLHEYFCEFKKKYIDVLDKIL